MSYSTCVTVICHFVFFSLQSCYPSRTCYNTSFIVHLIFLVWPYNYLILIHSISTMHCFTNATWSALVFFLYSMSFLHVISTMQCNLLTYSLRYTSSKLLFLNLSDPCSSYPYLKKRKQSERKTPNSNFLNFFVMSCHIAWLSLYIFNWIPFTNPFPYLPFKFDRFASPTSIL